MKDNAICCINLKSLYIPASIESIAAGSFANMVDTIFVAANKEKALEFKTNAEWNMTEYADRIAYEVEIQFVKGEAVEKQNKLGFLDATYVKENGVWTKISNYSLPECENGHWIDASENEVTLETLSQKLTSGESEDTFVVTFLQSQAPSEPDVDPNTPSGPSDHEPSNPNENPNTTKKNTNKNWIVWCVVGGVLIIAVCATVFIVLKNKKKKDERSNNSLSE